MNSDHDSFCEMCGERLEGGAKYCEACGHEVGGLKITPETPHTSGKEFNKQTMLSIGALVLIMLAFLIVFLIKPGNLFKKKPKEELPIASDQQSMPSQYQQTEELPTATDQQSMPSQQQQAAEFTTMQDQAAPPVVEKTPFPIIELIVQTSSDRKTFHCISSDGPATLTITSEVSPEVDEISLRWRLNTKNEGKLTDWEGVYMEKISANQFAYTFNADVWEGTNNFYYPPLLGESWFEYQLFLPDGSYQTEIFQEVTFFPCTQ